MISKFHLAERALTNSLAKNVMANIFELWLWLARWVRSSCLRLCVRSSILTLLRSVASRPRHRRFRRLRGFRCSTSPSWMWILLRLTSSVHIWIICRSVIKICVICALLVLIMCGWCSLRASASSRNIHIGGYEQGRVCRGYTLLSSWWVVSSVGICHL